MIVARRALRRRGPQLEAITSNVRPGVWPIAADQGIGSISPGRQVRLNHGSSGPYRRRIMNQVWPGTVYTQFDSLPAGALGPKNTSTEPSPFVCRSLFWLLTLGNCWFVCSIERVCVL